MFFLSHRLMEANFALRFVELKKWLVQGAWKTIEISLYLCLVCINLYISIWVTFT